MPAASEGISKSSPFGRGGGLSDVKRGRIPVTPAIIKRQKGHIMQNSYRNSLKRRISSSYIGVYAGICVLMLMSFVIGCGIFVMEKCEAPSEILSSEILEELSVREPEEIRDFLYERCIIHGVEEAFVYDGNGNLLVATSYVHDNDKYFSTSASNVILQFFPSFSELAENIYISEKAGTVFHPEGEYAVRIIMYHSIYGELAIFEYLINMSLVLMALGGVLFIMVGSSATGRMLSPIGEMTEVAKRISGENMDERFDVAETKSELSELAGTINSMMDRIEVSYDRQKQFVSDVSHELRTPISVISGYANMLRRWGSADEEILKEGVDNIIQEADTMSELVQTLLFLARHDNETLRFEPQDVDVSAMVTDIIRDAALANRDVMITSEVASPLTAYIDEARIRQAVRVFIDNAVKYTKEDDKRIFISLKKFEEHFEISVRDNGIGISAEDLEHIFDRFYRADESRTKATGGHGLGLSIAKVIVVSHGGKIRVRSRQGSGSEFIIMLPYRFPE